MAIGWLMLGIAIAGEVVGTIALKYSNGFRKLWPTVVVAVGYIVSFVALAQALTRGVPLGIAYAIWSGIGLAVVATVSHFRFGEKLGRKGIIGLALIICGCVVLELASGH